MLRIYVTLLFCSVFIESTFGDDIFQAPVLHPPQDTLRTETFWNFTFQCLLYNISGNHSNVVLSVTDGPVYGTTQTTVPVDNDTDVFDVTLQIEAGLAEYEGYKYLCAADYIDADIYVPGEQKLINNTGTGVHIVPHPASYSMNDNVTLSCQVELSRIPEGDTGQTITWYYDSEPMCIYYHENDTLEISFNFSDKILAFASSPDFGASEITMALGGCDGLANITCVAETVQNASAMFPYPVTFNHNQGYPEPFGDILGPDPPTDKAIWGFSYQCSVESALEVPVLTLNTTGGEAVSNTSQHTYSNETCLHNATHETELTLSYGECMSFLCIAEYPSGESRNYTGFDICYKYNSTDGKKSIEAWQVVVIVIVCILLIVFIIVGIQCYRKKTRGYQNIEKIN